MPAVERWEALSRREVTLPSGTRVRGVRADYDYLIAHDLFPRQLRDLVLGRKPGASDEQEDDRAQRYQLVHALAIAFVQEVWDPETEEWEEVRLGLSRFYRFDPADRTALVNLFMGVETAEAITARSRAARGEMPQSDADVITEAEQAKTVGGWATFRDESEGEGDRGDSEGVRPAPIDAAPYPGAARGGGGGRGAGAAAPRPRKRKRPATGPAVGDGR